MVISSESEAETEANRSFVVPPFASTCYEAARTSWKASYEHPFLKALLDGSLDRLRFRFYQMQDARYLEAYADACSLISVRFSDPERKLWFVEAARLALVVEHELHEGYGRKLGYSTTDVAGLELTPNNRAYQNHLLVSCQQGTLLEAVAALSPCPWLYAEIGGSISRLVPGIPDSHPYQEWLAMYADPSFVTYTNELLGHLQFLADRYNTRAHHRAAAEAFTLSVRYELMFWEQAWVEQDWTGRTEAVTKTCEKSRQSSVYEEQRAG